MLSHASRAVVSPTIVAASTSTLVSCSQSAAAGRRAAATIGARSQRGIATALVGQLGAALSQSRAQNSCKSQRQQQHYCNYSTSVSSKQWAVTSRKSTVAPSHLRQRRPIVNGEAVAFHVNDLAASRRNSTPPLPRPSLGSSSMSYSRSGSHGPASPSLSLLSPSDNNSSNSVTSGSGGSASRRYESDMVVVLDMDECLIHSQFLSPHNAQFFAYQLLNRPRRLSNLVDGGGASSQSSDNANANRRVENFRFALPDGDWVYVNLRPGLMEFLRAVSAKYETHIFTASMAVYADPLLNQLDPDGTMFSGRWYREHCTFDPAQQAYVKDLDRLPFKEQLHRVVLVDNNPLSFLTHPNNGILVSSFYNDPNDSSLQSVWHLLQELDRQPDVRPHLEQRFGIKKALAKLPLSPNNLNCFRAAAIQPQTQQHHDQQQPPSVVAVAAA
jgi:Dullard-like phosphatase family protein